MEFLFYLSPIGHQIYELASAKVRFVENPPICRKLDIFGYYESDKNLMTMCTARIKATDDPSHWMNEAIYHEAVHLAQDCKAAGRGWYQAFGISKSQMPLSKRRQIDLNTSVKMNHQNRDIEHEAFWMEDKPTKVKYVIEKYCFGVNGGRH